MSKRKLKFMGFQWLVLLLCLAVIFEVGASASNRFLQANNPNLGIYPSNFDVSLRPLTLGTVGPKNLRPAVDRLLESALNLYASYKNVPYVYGGSSLGSEKHCKSCSECVVKNKLKANSTLIRFQKCSACRYCGIDCSNFVNRVFNKAGLRYQFADTSTFTSSHDEYLSEKYGFINVGQDLSDLRAGDVVLEKGHVVMVVGVNHHQGVFDYVHASRNKKRSVIGGIEIRKSVDIHKFQRGVVKILRHRELFTPEDLPPSLNLSSKIWGKVSQWLVAS